VKETLRLARAFVLRHVVCPVQHKGSSFRFAAMKTYE